MIQCQLFQNNYIKTQNMLNYKFIIALKYTISSQLISNLPSKNRKKSISDKFALSDMPIYTTISLHLKKTNITITLTNLLFITIPSEILRYTIDYRARIQYIHTLPVYRGRGMFKSYR